MHTTRDYLNKMNSLNPIPSDLELDSLKKKDVGQVCGLWPFTSVLGEQYVEKMILHGETVCLRDKQGDLVGYIGHHEDGCFGFTHVRDDQRKRGLAKILLVQLGTKTFNSSGLDFLPIHSEVSLSNYASLALVKSLGFFQYPFNLFYHTLKKDGIHLKEFH